MRLMPLAIAGIFITMLGQLGCSTVPKTEAQQRTLEEDAQTTLRQFTRTDNSINNVIQNAHGYAIFPAVGKGGLIAGAAYGRGVVFEQGDMIGYADIRQGSIGAQAGGQNFAQLVVFETREAMDKLKGNVFSFGADASAIALKANRAAATEFRDGVAVFVMPRGGLFAGAAISGQQFTFVPHEGVEGATTSESGTTTRRSVEVQEKIERFD